MSRLAKSKVYFMKNLKKGPKNYGSDFRDLFYIKVFDKAFLFFASEYRTIAFYITLIFINVYL